jgi:hypothetical protein
MGNITTSQVIKNNTVNLRMNGAVKKVDCPCEGKGLKVYNGKEYFYCTIEDRWCKKGKNRGRRMYIVSKVMDHNGKLDEEEHARISTDLSEKYSVYYSSSTQCPSRCRLDVRS